MAARVVSADIMVNGSSFIQTFERLCDDYGFPKGPAFKLTARIYRGGGTTKDAIYLRGLVDVLDYLCECDGVEIDRLFVGKIAKAAVNMGHESYTLGVGDFVYAPDGSIHAFANAINKTYFQHFPEEVRP